MSNKTKTGLDAPKRTGLPITRCLLLTADFSFEGEKEQSPDATASAKNGPMCASVTHTLKSNDESTEVVPYGQPFPIGQLAKKSSLQYVVQSCPVQLPVYMGWQVHWGELSILRDNPSTPAKKSTPQTDHDLGPLDANFPL